MLRSVVAFAGAQLEHRIRLEDIYRNRVISLVTPIVGAGNVTAQVNLNIDFTRSEITVSRYTIRIIRCSLWCHT